jgi:hypothetical protein
MLARPKAFSLTIATLLILTLVPGPPTTVTAVGHLCGHCA